MVRTKTQQSKKRERLLPKGLYKQLNAFTDKVLLAPGKKTIRESRIEKGC